MNALPVNVLPHPLLSAEGRAALELTPAEADHQADKLVEARRKFGGPFAHEPGTKWKPHATRVLTAWMSTRFTAQ